MEKPIDPLKKICPRCRGRGALQGMVVVYCGMPGTCFKCGGVGEVYKSRFHQEFGVGEKFFGVTQRTWYNPGNPNNRIQKFIATPADYKESGGVPPSGLTLNARYEWKEITAEQAEAFFSKYGRSTYVPGDTGPEDSGSWLARRALGASGS